MDNAKFLPPSMDEATRRARRPRSLVITGTFNRNIALMREDLVFFAPTDDPWTDAIVANALEADRGRCCAILRVGSDVNVNWEGFEMLYSVGVDPQPLYAAGLPAVHLFRAQGYLDIPTIRVLVQSDGIVVPTSSPVWASTKRRFGEGDLHLGKRDEPRAQLAEFKRQYPPDLWHMQIENATRAARAYLADQLSFMEDEASRAKEEFAQRVAGWRAARLWMAQQTGVPDDLRDTNEYERVSAALVDGLRQPQVHLESVCFWVLRKGRTK